MSGQLWATDTLGGYMYSDELSDVLRTALQPSVKFRQVCDAMDASGKGLNAGDRFYWNNYGDTATRGGKLTENVPIPETNFDVGQNSLQVFEYGLAVPYTGLLDNMSKHPVMGIIHKTLKNDARKLLDSLAWTEMNKTKLRASVTTGTDAVTIDTAGVASLTNNLALGTGHVKAIVDEMKERNIPPFAADDYVCIAWPSTLRGMKNSLETIRSYTESGFQKILNGEVGRYEGVRFVEQTNIAKGGAADSTTHNWYTADAWNNAKSDWAFFLGEDTVAEAVVIPEEIRGRIPSDFGRSRGVAYYYLGGFGLIHTTAAESRIIKWDSAA